LAQDSNLEARKKFRYMSEPPDQGHAPSHVHHQLAIMAEEARLGAAKMLSRWGKKLGVRF